jgi:threonine/homoserine/homoserine lactone efflux protein
MPPAGQRARTGGAVLELAGIAGSSFVAALSGALAPGPVLAVTIAGARRQGFWFGPLVVLGHGLVELPVVLLLALGLGAVLDNRWVIAAIGLVGAAAMAWMGAGLLGQSRRPPEEAGAGGTERLGPVGSGALTSMLNPYWYAWWVVLGAVLLAGAASRGWLGVLVFFAGHISADLVWYSLISFGVARGRRLLLGRAYKVLLIACGLVLLGMAARFLWLGGTTLAAAVAHEPPGRDAAGFGGRRAMGPCRAAKKTPGVVSPKGPKGAAQKRHLVSFSRAAVAAPRRRDRHRTLAHPPQKPRLSS